MKLFIILLLTTCLIACENGHKADPVRSIDTSPNEQTKLDTNLVVPTNDDRIGWQKPDQVIKMLGDLDGESVADIGAGTGYFAFRLAKKAKKVIALDIDPDMIEVMDISASYLPKSIQDKFETRMVGEEDARLEEDEVDNIIIINTIAFINNKNQYLQNLKKGLKKGGKLMIVDFKMKRLAIDGPNVSDRIAHHEIENLIADAGYKIIASDDTTLQYQYIVVAEY